MTPSLKARGLTLIELLVTMVIFSLVIGVFSQALYQIGLVERRSNDSAKQWPRLWQQGFALDDAFKTQVAVQRREDPRASGNPQRLEATWVAEVGPYAGRALRAELRLRPAREMLGDSAAEGAWVLTRQWRDGALLTLPAHELAEVVVAQWPQAVRFRYVSATAAASDVWPPLSTRSGAAFSEVMPRAIQLLGIDSRVHHTWLYRGNTQAQSDLLSAPFGGAP